MNLSREAAEEAEPEVHHGESKILVEEIAKEPTHAQVRPAAVNQQEPLKEAKLSEGVVTGQHSLDPLLPRDPNADMSTWSRGKKMINMAEMKAIQLDYILQHKAVSGQASLSDNVFNLLIVHF